MLDRSRLPGKQVKAASGYGESWRPPPTRPVTASWTSWLDLLFGRPEAGAEDGRKSGFLGRLMKRSGVANPNELLQEVIASIRWPEGTQAKIGELRAQLEGAETDDAWVEVMRRISDLAAQALARAHQDAEASSVFLAQLTERLEAIDHYMLGDSERRQASRASGVALGEAVSNELGGLSASMQGEQELPALREQVLGVLDRIQHHVTDYLAHESQRSSSAEQEAERLQQQLHELEEETFKLRRQVEESRQLAMRDALTGLPNRRALEARAAAELARRRRFGKPLALVVFDVDDFKQINDVFGHKAGDRALALIARVFREPARDRFYCPLRR